jgi:hypothetical protein
MFRTALASMVLARLQIRISYPAATLHSPGLRLAVMLGTSACRPRLVGTMIVSQARLTPVVYFSGRVADHL